MRFLLAIVGFVVSTAMPTYGQNVSPHAIDVPPWFAETFLDVGEDIRDAAKEGKRLMLYFGQDGCPYCALLMQNFTQRSIVDKTRKHILPVALNIWGDREVTWLDGRAMSEKELARFLKVQFTPTLLFFDEQGRIIVRANGYYPPHRFEAVLDYVAARMEARQPFEEYMKGVARESASPELHKQAFLMRPPYDLRRTPGAKPLVALFETRYCTGCDELHKEGFQRPEMQALLGKFDIARFALSERSDVITPDATRTTADQWARSLKVTYTPTLVFFDPTGKEVFRIEAYLRPFHLASSFEYVASGAYRREPSFQRFISARAERIREQGGKVELWE